MSRTKKIAQIVMILIIGFAFGSGIASAEYLGPDRVHTIIVSEACEYGVWADEYSTCTNAAGDKVHCTICGWECEPGWPCGSATYYYSLGTKLVEHSVTTTDPEATVSITPNCGAWGDASWCLQPSSVTITANEPVSGEQITLIEGTQNGDAFACQASTCTVNIMGEGSNALTYWALSSYGDSSRMGTHTALQDTIAPEINASVTGTMGDNGWFVSNATLSVAFTDTLPGSGISSSSALFNGILTNVSSPVTITEGVYNIQLDTRDAAGWTASASQTVSVDTTAPAVTANQPPIEVANSNVTGGGYVNGSVVFTGTCSDATSGVDRIEISTDGKTLTSIAPNPDGTWTLDWDSSMLSDGTYTPVITAVDAAGNRTEITMQPFTLDNSAPAMSMTGAWYIWDSGHIEVFDSRVGIEHIELSVRDGQNRWPAREWSYDTAKLVMDLQWDRKFGDGTVAPTGDYEVLLQAWDQLGNGRYITSRIYIPEAGATAVIPLGDVVSGGAFEDTPTPIVEQTQTQENAVVPAAPAATEEAPPPTPEPSSTPSSLTFSSPPVISANGESKSTSLPVDPNLLTGAAALAAAASATAYSLQRKEEKAAERKRQEEQSRAEAMAIVRAAEATKIANYLKKLENDKIQAEKEKWLTDLRDTEGKKFSDLSDAEKEELKTTNIAAYMAVGEYYDEVFEQNAELSRVIASTGGRTITDLSKEQLDEFLNQGLGAKMAAGNYFTAQETANKQAIKQAAPQTAEWSRIIASTGGKVISDLSKDQLNEFMDQGLGAKMAASQFIAAQQAAYEAAAKAAYEEYLANKAYDTYLDKMERNEQEMEARNVRAPEKKPISRPPTSYGMSGIQTSTAYYPMGGGYSQDELQAMISANLAQYAEIQKKPSWDEKFRQSDLYQKIEPGLNWANDQLDSIKDAVKDAWQESAVYKWVKPKADWVADKYMGIWDTVGTAWNITTNANATFLQRLAASAYMTVAVVAHVMLATGLAILAYEAGGVKLLDAFDKFDAVKTLVSAPLQYADGDMSIGELGFQMIIGFADLDLPGGVKKFDEALGLVNPAKLVTNVDNIKDAYKLYDDYGQSAFKLLNSVDSHDVRKLMDNLDDVDIQNLMMLDDKVIKSIADMDDYAIKGLTGKLDVLADLGDDAIKQVNQHGPALLPFLNNYTDEGLQLINSSDEAAEFVLKHWDDAPEKVALAVDYGKPAMQLLETVDTKQAEIILENLDPKYVNELSGLSNEAIDALSKWPESDLSSRSAEIILRAESDAEMISDVMELQKTGTIDLQNLTKEQLALFDSIQEKVTQYPDAEQMMLGRWMGLDNGYVKEVYETGSKGYIANPELWNQLGYWGETQQKEMAWYINNNIIQEHIDDGLPFEYTFKGIPDKDVNPEAFALESIWEGASDEDIVDILDTSTMPSRMKELKALFAAGYEYTFDSLTNSYIFILP